MNHDQIIRCVTEATKDAPGVRGLFLSGSHGNGRADTCSDIDFVLVSEEGAIDNMAALWRGAIEQTVYIVLWWDRAKVPVLINAITADWIRTDVLILKPGPMGGQTQHALKPLFDYDGMLHLNRLITDEQQALMLSLPPVEATRDALIATHLAYAKAYLPRARKICTGSGHRLARTVRGCDLGQTA